MRTREVEAEHIEAMAAITAASRAAGQERTRAEAAEARVKELEAVRQDLLGKIVGWHDGARADRARIALLEAQNARLRAAHFEARDATATARGFMREAESMIASMVRTDDPMGYLVTGTAVRDNLRTGIKIIEDKWKLSEDLKAALSGEEASK